MMRLALGPGAPSPLVVLALGAHCDDIEIGCGGTVLRLVETNPALEVVWVVLAAEGERGDEARASADDFLEGAGTKRVITAQFRDSFFPYVGAEIKEFIESLRLEVDPDLVLTHCREDLHQDHRLVAELSWNAFRDHLILEYEIPKYDGDLGRPNVYVPLESDVWSRKIEKLHRHFVSQRERRWFTEELFLGLMRIRGMECNAESGYAEAYYGRKIVLSP